MSLACCLLATSSAKEGHLRNENYFRVLTGWKARAASTCSVFLNCLFHVLISCKHWTAHNSSSLCLICRLSLKCDHLHPTALIAVEARYGQVRQAKRWRQPCVHATVSGATPLHLLVVRRRPFLVHRPLYSYRHPYSICLFFPIILMRDSHSWKLFFLY